MFDKQEFKTIITEALSDAATSIAGSTKLAQRFLGEEVVHKDYHGYHIGTVNSIIWNGSWNRSSLDIDWHTTPVSSISPYRPTVDQIQLLSEAPELVKELWSNG